MDINDIGETISTIARDFAADRGGRQRRTALDPADFERLRSGGYLLMAVPRELGGCWASVQQTTRPLAEILRTLAAGDPSVALVASMHPSVLAFWLATETAPEPHAAAWNAQRQEIFATVRDGAWWGTITSEPGSGGDVMNSKATAELVDGGYRLTGQKHFGSGSGITSYMLTTALPAEAEEPDWFFLDVRDAAWDGGAGMKLIAPWDGHGMAATQSHGFAFEGFPATRIAWAGHLMDLVRGAGPFFGCLFTAVILGVVQTAVTTARAQLEAKRESLRSYERVEWAAAQNEAWLMAEAYEGMLRAVESADPARASASLRGKTACAGLAESVLTRICRVIGGGTFGRGSPFGFWFEDVRALGFLRPPWGLAYDQLFELDWDSPGPASGRPGNIRQ